MQNLAEEYLRKQLNVHFQQELPIYFVISS